MFVRLENNVVVEIFDEKPILHRDVMASIFQVEAEIGDLIFDGENKGPSPSDIHFISGGEWAVSAELQKEADRLGKKINGFEFDGVNCSVTKADQDGVTAILVQFNLKLIQETVFEFSNGSELLINTNNVKRFGSEWAKCRQQFFKQV